MAVCIFLWQNFARWFFDWGKFRIIIGGKNHSITRYKALWEKPQTVWRFGTQFACREIKINIINTWGRGSAVGKLLHYKSEGRWIDFRWCHWNFLLTKSFRSHYGPGVDSASNRNEYHEYFLGGKGGRCIRLTTLRPSCTVVMKSGNLNFLEPCGHLGPVTGLIYIYFIFSRGTAVAQWLTWCATNRKVAGSIPDGTTGIFYWQNPSDRTIVLGSTQPLTEMSTRSISWGVKAAGV